MSSKTIAERMGGMMDHGFYATIVAVARHLGLSYPAAQRELRKEFLAGSLERQRFGRRIAYSSKQLPMFSSAPARRKPSRSAPRPPPRSKVDDSQRALF